jgi:hypothetical protein
VRALTRRRPQPTRPEPVFSQEELRERRRAGLTTVYGGGFSLADEVAAVVRPLAYRTSRLPSPRVCAARVDDLADATHELVSTVIGWLAEVDARARTAHLANDTGRRTAAIRLMVDLAQRPDAPEIGPDQLVSGSWAASLIEMTQPHSAALADLLDRARPPGDPQLRGVASRSERLCDLLGESVDYAARELSARIERAEGAATKRLRTPNDPNGRAEAARAQLRELGIEVNA